MRTKILLLGTNTAAIDDFFDKMNEGFELQSTSLRYDDIVSHMKYFQPAAIIYCLARESRDDISRMVPIKHRLQALNTPFIILGDDTDCDDFTKTAVHVADFVLTKPLTAATIQNQLHWFLEQWDTEHSSINAFPQEASTPAEPEHTEDDPHIAGILRELGVSGSVPENADKRKHILVIDDDIRMLRVIKAHLENEYTVATAISGAVGLRFLEKNSTDLILLDYEMPDEKGPDVLAKIRANDTTKDIPVLFLTGAAERSKIQKALSMKPQGYMLKPIEQEKLLAKIKELLK